MSILNESSEKIINFNKMLYALKEGILTHVSEVPSGLKCECVCPHCNAKLVARKGDIKQHHFAHAKGEDCKLGIETSLHIMAKSFLEKEKRIKIPRAFVLTKFTAFDYEGHSFVQQKYHEYVSEAMDIEFDRVELETHVDDFIPDVTLYINNQCLLVEIKVTHGIDDVKMKKIQSCNISLLEVDLSNFKGSITETELKNILLENLNHKHWIYNKRAEQFKSEWFNLCNNLKPITRENPKAKYEAYRYIYQVASCPINKRTYKGHSYAIVQIDCFYCEYCIDIKYEPMSYHNELDKIIHICCCGRYKIGSVDKLKSFLKLKSI